MELHLSPSRQLSTTFPLTHGSAAAASQIISPPNPDKPLAVNPGVDARNGGDGGGHVNPTNTPREEHHHRHLPVFDGARLDPTKLRTRHKHKHSKSREVHFPRIMNPITSSTGARALLPTWSGGREKEEDTDDGLLRPVTRETTRSRWGSDSTVGYGHRMSGQQKIWNKFLRSALSFIGTLATDITRRLDYTYYNLLEKIAALNTTVSSFQELADSTSTLFADFERETASLEQDVRKQIGELREFQPQIQRIESFEERMRVGRARASALSGKLEAMRAEIDHWEKREVEYQTRINRRLRLFWAVAIGGILTVVVALAIQNWSSQLDSGVTAEAAPLGNGSSHKFLRDTESWEHILPSGRFKGETPMDEHISDLRISSPMYTSTSPGRAAEPKPTEQDPLRLLDEL
ncbi:hypothetical protein FE257_007202 [Aspergillus nanangensis]|uniref:Uncharacterized protein n=1 Tax=Aspergillus nanangensis TaxID=2582783 RepID=A0AAD4CNI3_ASPNN|nr:hypothetical protein FE257_007202 [Aspergillus nanangensis]